ncbi:Uncharacterised protein (plasmid) [Tsukamurella tyrosinosolvens]|uniref:Uncharacterized protein n=1 Tax=Tsukamurella tyrosinosolvens TaxID=57704 RepID=A0A1H4UVT4_TSUTY|nr:hypothetical protein [Tsukamurella tyrosinosolvens]KXO98396.1 hypothetical protein AXK58_25320 [Tsukamurella tyrosinosolvens]SEC72660.1 hypothetical protein SAMN04489793_3051 [Tsukamurella tyrosinosolvens]VEH90859.1 Uncharacterised protein [Tsukamurella tyrosinosolvens]
MKIIEQIHHGDYQSERTVEFPDDASPAAIVAELLPSSAYCYRVPSPDLQEKLAASLTDKGRFEHGWSRFWIEQ